MLKINNTKANARGKNIFQQSRINWSTRYRGKDALTHIKKNRTKLVLIPRTKGSRKKSGDIKIHPPINISIVIKLIRIIEPYSAKKNNAKPILAYSTLNPDTSSDSASGRSKGARLVSAKIEIRNIKNNGKSGKAKNT